MGCLSGVLTLDLVVESSDRVEQVIDLAHSRLGNGRALDSARLVLLSSSEAWPKTPMEITKICRKEPFRPKSRLCREGFQSGSKAVLIYLEEVRIQLGLIEGVAADNGAGVGAAAVVDADNDRATLATHSVDVVVPTVYDKNGRGGAYTYNDGTDSKKMKEDYIRAAIGSDFSCGELKLNTGGRELLVWDALPHHHNNLYAIDRDPGPILLGLLAGMRSAGGGGGAATVVQGVVTLMPGTKSNGIFGKLMGADGGAGTEKLLKDNNPDGHGITIKNLKQAFTAAGADYKQLMVFLPGKVTEVEDESTECRKLVSWKIPPRVYECGPWAMA